MLFEGKAVHLNKGDSFTFYENEPTINEPGNYVSKPSFTITILTLLGTSEGTVWKCFGW